uniref:NinB protein n=1 Tax=Siphoviridae sp. ctRCE13 TaxID=2826332 RepID=A0A8S5QP90_9CAUD|nr:MAG TPA: NinB protein [Siphoviridae sp. ctRCE13]
MQTTGTLEEINIDYKTGKPKISFLINERDKLSDIEQLKGLKLKIEAKRYIKKRTTNANNYFWKLLQELCDLADIDTIEEYKRRVKKLGIFRRFKIEKDNVNTFEKMWTAQGIAWFCEIADTTYIGDTEFKIINAYYGSSSFNSKQMARLIDGVIQDCKVYVIETKPQAEIDSLLKEWDKK